MFSASVTPGKIHIQPRKDLVTVRKADLIDGKTQKPLRLRNKGLLSLDGGGLRGLLTGEHTVKLYLLSSCPGTATCCTLAAVQGRKEFVHVCLCCIVLQTPA